MGLGTRTNGSSAFQSEYGGSKIIEQIKLLKAYKTNPVLWIEWKKRRVKNVERNHGKQVKEKLNCKSRKVA